MTVPRLPLSLDFSTSQRASHRQRVSQSSPSALLRRTSVSFGGRLERWVVQSSTFTQSALATRSGWDTTTAGCAPLPQTHRCKSPKASYLVGTWDSLFAGLLVFLTVAFGVVKMSELSVGKALAFALLKFAQCGADDPAGIVVTARRNQCLIKLSKWLVSATFMRATISIRCPKSTTRNWPAAVHRSYGRCPRQGRCNLFLDHGQRVEQR